MNSIYQYTNKPKQSNAWVWLIFVAFTMVGITMAWFFVSDYASKYNQMSGKVAIEAVGKGDTYQSIENGISTGNLVIQLEDNYDKFIPGMEVRADANCKIYKSTTKPLLRARFSLSVIDSQNNSEYDDAIDVESEIFTQVSQIITADNDWYFHTDGYYYYIGSVVQPTDASNGEYILQEIDASNDNVIVNFIDQSFIFPTFVTSDLSGFQIKIIITFQAIQNFIPDDDGQKLPNTIVNSLKIFNTF